MDLIIKIGEIFIDFKGKKKKSVKFMIEVGFEPTPFRTGA